MSTLIEETLPIENEISSLGIIAEDPRMQLILKQARKAAKSNATVLISGETGVGKEVLAQYIHHESGMAEGPFISVNCAALPDTMMEAILFGYEKGSFTSAVNSYMGKFEQAHNGTLLLDEIAEISINLQAKLLRVLQEREVERLGGKKLINVNVRIIAATNRDLMQQVKRGLFRQDLYYRLNVIPIHCIPLRERQADILPLANYFLTLHAKKLSIKMPILSNTAKEKLKCYAWPGNIREMDNVIQRAIVMQEGEVLNENDIHLLDLNFPVIKPTANIPHSLLEEGEANVILTVLAEVEGCKKLAAERLNISPRTLRYKLAKLRSMGFKVPDKHTGEDNEY